MQAVRCPVCNGSGKYEDKPCHGCNGKGWVEVHDSHYPYPWKPWPSPHPWTPWPETPWKRPWEYQECSQSNSMPV